MKISGNTILITGGGSGIGRALAEALHAKGNKVVIAGRREAVLDAVTAANPGMESMLLDIQDGADIAGFARQAVKRFPSLNAVINNAGIMKPENVPAADNLAIAEETIATNLLGPIRLTTALLPHFLKQPRATVLTVSSGLAFVPLALTPTYSATKAAIHSWSIGLREQLKDTSVEVVEIAPPYVQTELMGAQQAADPAAMPLADFISEVMTILETQPEATEVIVERCKPLRDAEASGNFAQVFAALNARHG
ncbi:MAG: SDR family oxidoreductase [Bosea sp.]|uniref:SDR family oxidoreductase n=1 Tax=unclassified Bosea (in: a-proteobacteria) TaxID=2653178 RepID=UPI00095DB6E5|nr:MULTISPECIES: SDR family oxidoreductase [unclassified Bosea (in: a-proteobacteria)]MBN9456105.1 SDR family oxidoreductase [Bosea sp. (in: a-proteobacteria)]OJV05621.1 MAG: oxidoreductase [Bosea sp. 67-29]